MIAICSCFAIRGANEPIFVGLIGEQINNSRFVSFNQHQIERDTFELSCLCNVFDLNCWFRDNHKKRFGSICANQVLTIQYSANESIISKELAKYLLKFLSDLVE